MDLFSRRTTGVIAISTFLAMLAPLGAVACTTDAQLITGLDPTQLVTSAGISVSTMKLTALANETDRTLAVNKVFDPRSEVLLLLPYRDTRSIDGIGSQSGAGDLSIGYRRLIGRPAACIAQVLGLGLSFASRDATFSSGQTQLEPSYALSFHLAKRLSFIAESNYSFASSTEQGFAQARGLDVTPTILTVLSKRGAYAAFSTDIRGVRGTYRYTSFESTLRVGALFSHRWNLSAFFTVPTSNNTYNHVMHVAYGVSLAIQRP